ncbi:hypothetical protein AK830_g11120 [Neonectria ditissima]|uniref:Lymphoid-specific helicase n=1 Tax=Neonectria ditissima TaxID=78410 RepID=A0A0P7B421_9HYPO|nr:hypothetical protein AK830_g11120 [Neonectria ditissima]
MDDQSPSDLSESAASRLPTSVPSSPPSESFENADFAVDETLIKEEESARAVNERAEEKRRQALLRKRKKKKPETKAEREEKARELDELLMKSAAFSDILTNKTKVLGRVGSNLDGKTLGEHNLEMAKQPECMVGGTMRDYQLEGLTWMYEICSQGMSGILADEMGLGKTVQTIALIAHLREKENYLGPHLIVAPLSTLSNWMDEFHKWTPSIPVIMYHGNKAQREEIFKTKMMRHLKTGRPTDRFPVVCTSYEMVLNDRHNLSRINWEFIIIDEGHRMKNAEAKLFQQLRQFSSATRLLITGTPLQNNLKELWSLLHFLLPNIFTDWEAFESWFDFSDLEDEKGTQEFIGDQKKQDLVKKIHLILQPMLLRRVKQDVAAYLPKKREYVLFAPMTKEQTDLYNALSNKNIDSREYLETKVFEQIKNSPSTPATRGSSRSASVAPTPKSKISTPKTMSLPLRESPNKKKVESRTSSPAGNAFSMMMGKRGPGRPRKTPKTDEPKPATPSTPAKRKIPPGPSIPEAKSARSSRSSTPANSRRGRRKATAYKEADSDEERMSDDAFEAKLAKEMANEDSDSAEPSLSPEELQREKTLELAKKQISHKKLGNTLAQLRLVCNSPHNFYNPWSASSDVPVDESIITASGKMLLLDRLLLKLLEDNHKVLIFSQFTTQLDILEDYCRELRDWNVCRIDGSVSQDSRGKQIHAFNHDPDYKIFLLSTRAGGQGINLASADTVVLFDSDFNPQQDLQAQDRCHRIGQTRPVIVYRLATKDTVEEQLLLAANAKRRLEKLIIKKGTFKSMGRKRDLQQDLDAESLKALLLKDGEVYKLSGSEEVLSDEDLKVLCDRSEAAYEQAASGQGDADGYRVVETGADSIKMAKE